MRRDPEAVLADLECLLLDARDALDAGSDSSRLVLVHLANARECLRAVVESPRDSLPPGTLGANQPKRTAATMAFRNARKLLEGIK